MWKEAKMFFCWCSCHRMQKSSLVWGWHYHSLCSWLMEQDNLTDTKWRPNIKAVYCTHVCYLVENDIPPARGNIPTAARINQVLTIWRWFAAYHRLPAIFETIRWSLLPQRSQQNTSDFLVAYRWLATTAYLAAHLMRHSPPTHYYNNSLDNQESRDNSCKYNHVYRTKSAKVSKAPYGISQWCPIGG